MCMALLHIPTNINLEKRINKNKYEISENLLSEKLNN